jgi:6-pyruvoyltetrahydropterin/6-carboxytetrahydropterin synthase
MILEREFHYDSAHYLPNVPEGHKCGRMHGHTYRLIVTIAGRVDEHTGWMLDFSDIDQAVKPLVDRLDHHVINDVLPNPTVELQLIWFWDQLAGKIPLLRLRIFEGLKNSGTYEGDG